MATLTIDVPDALVPDLTQAISSRMRDTPDATIRAIAEKALAGQTTTASEKQALARAFMKDAAKGALLDYRAQQAALLVRDTDNARDW